MGLGWVTIGRGTLAAQVITCSEVRTKNLQSMFKAWSLAALEEPRGLAVLRHPWIGGWLRGLEEGAYGAPGHAEDSVPKAVRGPGDGAGTRDRRARQPDANANL